MAPAEDEGFHVEWIYQEIDKILKARVHYRLAKNADQLRERIIVL